ncbi:hypothetical protein AQUCO_00100880v1 [Aquilegia coerulea]|uniref:Uncharacterized protein n=1 Tax=Aquilegia coerulea TaxID=218851 RepID=A0A2G5FCJ3_AQUCA|nr:hypothetical protein AQUCO_00100880v1 [Aquilegia coerulea]
MGSVQLLLFVSSANVRQRIHLENINKQSFKLYILKIKTTDVINEQKYYLHTSRDRNMVSKGESIGLVLCKKRLDDSLTPAEQHNHGSSISVEPRIFIVMQGNK